MKALIWLSILLAAGTLWGAPEVRILGVGDGAETPPPAFHVWGGQALELSLEIVATDPAPHLNVRASLHQITSAISAPLASELPVAQELTFDRSLARFEKWKVTPPSVRHVTTVQLRFDVQAGEGNPWQPAGSARLVIYPADLTEQWKKAVAEAESRESGRLAVFGDSVRIKTALRRCGVDFEDLGDTLPSQLDRSLLYLGECTPSDLVELRSREKLPPRLILFVDDPELLPGVYWSDHGAGFLAKVTLPIWQDFARSPQRQSAFFNLLQRAFKTPFQAP